MRAGCDPGCLLMLLLVAAVLFLVVSFMSFVGLGGT